MIKGWQTLLQPTAVLLYAGERVPGRLTDRIQDYAYV